MSKSSKDNNSEPVVISATPLEVIMFAMECGGEQADIIANTPDDTINELMNEIDEIKIIL